MQRQRGDVPRYLKLLRHGAELLEEGRLTHMKPVQVIAQGWGHVAAARLQAFVGQTDASPATVIAVGGAVLGGAGKTPFAIALSSTLAEQRSGPVVHVSHAYRAATDSAAVVDPATNVRLVGDDALHAAQRLREKAVVIAGRQRSACIAAASTYRPSWIVVDGSFALPADLRILVHDADMPWGAGACPPAGDLRAPRATLERVADLQASLRDELSSARGPGVDLPMSLHVIDETGRAIGWECVQRARTGLLTAIGRPKRVLRSLQRRHVTPRVQLHLPDHHADLRPLVNGYGGTSLDAWLVTEKDAPKLPAAIDGVPRWTLVPRLTDDARQRLVRALPNLRATAVAGRT